MKPVALDYVRAEGVEHTLDLLEEYGDDAKLLAGGQSLIPMLNLRLARPGVLIDISRVALDYVKQKEAFHLGALTKHRRLEFDESIRVNAPIFARCVRFIGHPAIRNRGTIGGSIAHADSRAELCVASVAAGASFVVESRSRGRRTIEAVDFFRGPFTTAIESDEMLTEVLVPLPSADEVFHFEEVSERLGDFAVVAIAARYAARDSQVASPRLAIGGLGACPVRLSTLETCLDGTSLGDWDSCGAEEALAQDLHSIGIRLNEKAYEVSLVRGLLFECFGVEPRP